MQAEAAHQDALIIRRVKPGITKVSPILYPASRAPECILRTLPLPSSSFVLILRPRPLTSRTHTHTETTASAPWNGRSTLFPSLFSSFFPSSPLLPPLSFSPPRYISGSISHATKDVLVCARDPVRGRSAWVSADNGGRPEAVLPRCHRTRTVLS